ncbi:MAG: YvcK family protein [Chloroflexi bacterium]|nr:YvcK family protein [Chloroflexota bacterium]
MNGNSQTPVPPRATNGNGSGESLGGLSDILRLFEPGLGVKRWMLLGAAGISICSIGIAYLLRKFFALGFPDFLPGYFEGALLIGGGILIMLLAVYGLYRSVGPLILQSPSIHGIANTIYTRRSRGRGPRIVTIGGGTGLSVLLRGLKAYTDNITAIVTVGDDGGSSGRLRRELGVLPPGDFRNCLVALSDDESLLSELFQYRFDQGNGLKGHSFGNLFIAAMTNVTGSFEQALFESSRVLAVHGRIVPTTTANLQLSARLADGSVVKGESKISEAGGHIERLMIDPPDATVHPLALDAIQNADLIAIGPGSLYTSILPNLMVRGLTDAIAKASAAKVYICNVATQKGETEGYTVADHHEALKAHTSDDIVDYVVANERPVELGPRFFGTPVAYDGTPLAGARVVLTELTSSEHPVRHDSDKLARAIMDVYDNGSRLQSLIKSGLSHRTQKAAGG